MSIKERIADAVDFSKEWKTLTGTELVQGCIIARKEFIALNSAKYMSRADI